VCPDRYTYVRAASRKNRSANSTGVQDTCRRPTRGLITCQLSLALADWTQSLRAENLSAGHDVKRTVRGELPSAGVWSPPPHITGPVQVLRTLLVQLCTRRGDAWLIHRANAAPTGRWHQVPHTESA
jgi:hypothetical protein